MSTSKVYKHLKNYQTLIYHIECLRPLIHIPNLIIQFSTMGQEGKLGQNGIAIKQHNSDSLNQKRENRSDRVCHRLGSIIARRVYIGSHKGAIDCLLIACSISTWFLQYRNAPLIQLQNWILMRQFLLLNVVRLNRGRRQPCMV